MKNESHFLKKATFSPKCRLQLTPFFLQVFDVVLNGDLTIASDLDVFERVGRGVAHDEYIDFEVKDGKILYEGDESEISAGKIRVKFIKSYFSNLQTELFQIQPVQITILNLKFDFTAHNSKQLIQISSSG